MTFETRRRPDGSIDLDYYRSYAERQRLARQRSLIRSLGRLVLRAVAACRGLSARVPTSNFARAGKAGRLGTPTR